MANPVPGVTRTALQTLPMIDVSAFPSGPEAERRRVAAALRAALYGANGRKGHAGFCMAGKRGGAASRSCPRGPPYQRALSLELAFLHAQRGGRGGR